MSKLVVSNKALKLAEKWVDGMSKAPDYDTTALELESRPSRLGLGAKVPRKIEIGPLHDPVERKLNSKLNVTKRTASQIASENGRSNAETNSDDDSDEEEPGGRSQVRKIDKFWKKMRGPEKSERSGSVKNVRHRVVVSDSVVAQIIPKHSL